jgi:hypothetical protein
MFLDLPGSESISQRSFYHHAKIVEKNLDSYCFVSFFDFLSLKKDVNEKLNIPSKSTVKSRKSFSLKLVFCWRVEGQ